MSRRSGLYSSAGISRSILSHNQLFSIHFISFINSPKANNVREEHMAPGAVTQSVKLPAGHVRHAVAPVDEYLESSAQSSHSFCPAELYLPI